MITGTQKLEGDALQTNPAAVPVIRLNSVEVDDEYSVAPFCGRRLALFAIGYS
jgi:hypothetical protein